MPALLYAEDLVLCGEYEEDLRAVVGCFVKVCSRRGLKVNAGVGEGLESEVCVDGMRLEHVSEFKYLGCVLDELHKDEAQCRRKVASGKRAVSAIISG